MTMAMPGLVQNCPAPIVDELTHPDAMSEPRLLIALGKRNIGFTDPNSPKNGIGSSLAEQRSNSALPPAREPVKPTALINGC